MIERNFSQNCVQHEKQLCRHLMEEATVYSRVGFFAKDTALALARGKRSKRS